MNALEGARAALDAARVVLADAERGRVEAERAEGAALLALADAGEAYGDAPGPAGAATWREARDARDLAALALAGAERRLLAARAALQEAELADARARLADALPRADRGAMLAALHGTILDLAALDVVPAVDTFAALPDDTIAALLNEQGERDIARKLAHRTIRRAVTAQAAAVDDARAAAKDLGERAPAVAPVPEAHVFSAVALEVYLRTQPSKLDRSWWDSWIAPFYGPFPPSTSLTFVGGADKDLGFDVAAWIAWGRETVRTGEPDTARRTVADALLSPEERAARAALAAERRAFPLALARDPMLARWDQAQAEAVS